MTGYAKDYVGQLCREGRVPARLVGRSWYVLESAIQDHRFGTEQPTVAKTNAPEPEETPITDTEPSLSTWEAPQYMVAPEPDHVEEERETVQEDLPQRIQDSWKEWFDRFDPGEQALDAGKEASEKIGEEGGEKKEDEAATDEEEGVRVPIRAYPATTQAPLSCQALPEEFLPRIGSANAQPPVSEEKAEPESKQSRPTWVSGRAKMLGAVRIVGIALAIIMVILAAIGSGYFDSYVLSAGRVGLLAGVSAYTR